MRYPWNWPKPKHGNHFNVACYLRPTPTIDSDATSIKEMAFRLTQGQREISDKAKSLFYFVRDVIKYNMYSPFHLLEYYRASTILSRKEGYCVQKAVLLAALARAIDIPARLRFAQIRNHLLPPKALAVFGTNVMSYHGYNELYIGGKWVKATPTFDLKMCQKNRIIPVEFDGKNHATFHSHNWDRRLHIEYIHDYGYYGDVPLDKILNAWIQVYGAERVELFKRTFGKR